MRAETRVNGAPGELVQRSRCKSGGKERPATTFHRESWAVGREARG